MRNFKAIFFALTFLCVQPLLSQNVTEQYNAYTSFISFFNALRADTPNGLENLESQYKKTKNAFSDKQTHPKFTNFVATKSDYMYASALNVLGKYDQSLRQLENISSNMKNLSAADYPVEFSSGGQTYTIDANGVSELKKKYDKLLSEVRENRQNTGGGGISAQTYFDRGVDATRGISQYHKLVGGKYDDEAKQNLRNRLKDANENLDQAAQKGSAQLIKAARYYKMIAKVNYSKAQVLAGGEYFPTESVDEYMKNFESEITGFSASEFPYAFIINEERKTVSWNNMKSQLLDYWINRSETAYLLNDAAATLATYKKVFEFQDELSARARYGVEAQAINISGREKGGFNTEERLAATIRAVQNFAKMPESDQKDFLESPFVGLFGMLDVFETAGSSPASIGYINKNREGVDAAMDVFAANGLGNNVIKFNNRFKEGKKDDAAALRKYLNSLKNFESQVDNAEKKAVLSSGNQLGVFCVDQIMEKTPSRSELQSLKTDVDAVSANFSQLKEKSTILEQKIAALLEKERIAEAKRQADIAAAEAARQAEAARRAAIEKRKGILSNVYIGLDLGESLKGDATKRNYGGHIDFRGRRHARSFGFNKVQSKQDFNADKTAWSGYRAYFVNKKFSGNLYQGFLLGYADKTFGAQTAKVQAVNTTREQTILIKPSEKQYEFLLMMGSQNLVSVFGMDIWAGIGGSFHDMKVDAAQMELLDKTKFTFTENNEGFFKLRQNTQTFHPIIRMGISLGLNIGGTKRR